MPDPAWADEYRNKVPTNSAFFFAAIGKIDARIGQLRAALAEEGLGSDTILIFLADNGGTVGVKLFNAGMREGKGEVYDGGHRVLCFIRWPAGKLRHGEDIAPLNAHLDLLPTLVDLCGLKLPRPVDFDGRSLRAQLTNARAEVPERTLFVELQRTFEPRKWANTAAMTPRWRLVNNQELYDIKQDPGQQHNVIADHPDVAKNIRKQFEAYWTRVTPGDRDRAEFIVGDERDPETFLHPSGWYLPEPLWHHARVAAGPDTAGDWHIRAARAGIYRFEVRRWPREADAPLAGTPKITKTVDAWDVGGPKPDLLYGSKNTKFTALPVAAVRLNVDGKSQTLPTPEGVKEAVFDLELKAGRTFTVQAELLDGSGKTLAGGYYVYCRRK